MKVKKTKLNTYIIQILTDGTLTDIVSDCFNSRLLLYHFPDEYIATDWLEMFFLASTGEGINNVFDLIPNEFYILDM